MRISGWLRMWRIASATLSNIVAVVEAAYWGYIGRSSTRSAPARLSWPSTSTIDGVP
jgi:hypothetical protein